MTEAYVLPIDIAPTFGIATSDEARRVWLENDGDPRLYPYSAEEYGVLEQWWIADMSALPSADLESELQYVTRRLVDLRLTPDTAEGLIDGVQQRPILEARADWLAWETKRRGALPEPPKVGFSISADFVRALKDRVSLPQFIEQRIGVTDIKPRGRDFVALCPFHSERTPSFLIHQTTWHCFGACQQSGDVFDLVLVSGLARTWRSAVEYVADYAGMSMPKPPDIARPVATGNTVRPVWQAYSA